MTTPDVGGSMRSRVFKSVVSGLLLALPAGVVATMAVGLALVATALFRGIPLDAGLWEGVGLMAGAIGLAAMLGVVVLLAGTALPVAGLLWIRQGTWEHVSEDLDAWIAARPGWDIWLSLRLLRDYVTGGPTVRALGYRELLLLCVFAAFYVGTQLIASAASASAALVATYWSDPSVVRLGQDVVQLGEGSGRFTRNSFFYLAVAVVLATPVALLLVPRAPSRQRHEATLTFLFVGSAWAALLYQAGSAAGFLHFALAESGEAPVALSAFDAAYVAVGTLVTAGSGGITPVSGITRFFLAVQLLLLALVVYWLFQSRGDPQGAADTVREAVVASEVSGSAVSSPASRKEQNNHDPEVLRAVLALARTMTEEEAQRTRTIETKATTVTSALGVMGVFIVNAAGLLLNADHAAVEQAWLRIVMVAAYLSTGVAFLVALRYSLRAAGIHSWSRPHPDLLVDMQGGDLPAALDLEIRSLHSAWRFNNSRNNELADFLRTSQRFIGLAASGQIVLASLLAGIWLFG